MLPPAAFSMNTSQSARAPLEILERDQTPLSSTTAVVSSSQSISNYQTVLLIFCITCITGIGNLLSGLLTVCIPTISNDLSIPPAQQLWPVSAFALACGCTLLPCGAAADVLGCRKLCLFGALFQALSALGSGLVKTSTQLIALRSCAGIAASFCLPSAVGVISHVFPANSSPRRRSAAFAAMGGGQAVGFGLGLTLGGVCADTIGWRWGFYITALLNGIVLFIALWALPSSADAEPFERTIFVRLLREVDWLGAFIVSALLAMLSYELAVATDPDAKSAIHQPLNLSLLCVALILFPVFGLWMRRQVRLGRPALIPNALWANMPFTAVCVIVFLVWGALNASEQLTALYLQDVRDTSATTASLYFLPAPICGALMNVAVGVFLPRLRPSHAVSTSCLVSAVAPLLLATLCQVQGPSYWRGVFQAMALNPLGADLIYTVANEIVTDAFPTSVQATAGGVFNMLAQIGKSVGIATTAVIARQVASSREDTGQKASLLVGYKAGWWYNCALNLLCAVICMLGLRSVKKLGIKRE